jgi:Zn-finger protein
MQILWLWDGLQRWFDEDCPIIHSENEIATILLKKIARQKAGEKTGKLNIELL